MSADESIADVLFDATDITGPPKGSSGPTRTRRKQRREKNNTGGKAGNPGLFHGEREKYIDENFDAYSKVKGKGRKIQNRFFRPFFAGYWAKFPWQLPLNKEPSELAEYPPPPPGPETTELQGETVKKTEKRLKSHLRHRFNAANLKENNPWCPLLQALKSRAQSLPVPRRLATWQVYMIKKPDEINDVYEDRWLEADLPATRSLAFRAKIARELLAEESEEYRSELEEEAVRMHEEEMEEYKSSQLPNASQTDGDAVARAREDFAAVVQPLLELLQEYTGLYCTLIAGVALPPGPQEFFLKVVTAGRTAGPVPKPWHLYEQKPFAEDVMRSFTRFLMQTPEYLQRSQGDRGGGSGEDDTFAELSSLGLTIPPHPSPSPPAKPTSTSASKRGKKGKHAAKGKHAVKGKRAAKRRQAESSDEAESSSSDEDEDDGEEDEGDEDEGDEEGKPRAPTPTMEELGFNAAVAAKLNALPRKRRRSILLTWAKLDQWERDVENRRADTQALLQEFSAEVSSLKVPAKPKPRPKKKPEGSSSAPPRRSQRLQAPEEGGGMSLEPPTPTTASPEPATTARSSTPATSTAPVGTSTTTATTASAEPGAPLTNTSGERGVSTTTTANANNGTHGTSTLTNVSAARGASTVATGNPSTNTPRGPGGAPVNAPGDASTNTPAAPGGASTNAPGGSSSASPAPGGASTNAPGGSSMNTPAAPGGASTNAPGGSSTSASPAPGGASTNAHAAPGGASTNAPGGSSTSASPAPGTSTNASTELGGASTTTPGASAPASFPPNVAVDMSGWPAWLKEGFKRLDHEEYGEAFGHAVAWWALFERRHNWATTTKGLPTDNRPDEVAEWLRFGRKLDKSPSLEDEAAYAQRWWSWWTGLQPEWRQSGDGTLVRAGGGPWGKLEHPGKNGLFMVLMSLMWWKEAATTTASQCEDAAIDVSWVVWQLAASKGTSRKRSSEQAEPDATVPKAKKTRRR